MNAKIITPVVLAANLSATVAQSGPLRVYFGTSHSKGIYLSRFDTDTGALSPPRLAIEIERPGFIAIHPNRQFVYSTTSAAPDGEPGGGVAALSVLPDGSLELINLQSSAGGGPCHVSIDTTGTCLMVANYGSGAVAALKINQDGSLEKSTSIHQHVGSGPHPRRQEGPHAHSIFPGPHNTFAYACDLGLEQVVIYRLDPGQATLTPAGSAVVPGDQPMGPRHLKWSSDGKSLYVLNELDVSLSLFRAGALSGELTFQSTVPAAPGLTEADGITSSEVRIHPNGQYVYAGNRDVADHGRDSITVFSSTDHPKGFARLQVAPAQVRQPRNFAIDPTGHWMLVGGQDSHDVAVFSIDPDTGLLSFTGTRIPFEGSPICIEFVPVP